MQFPSQTAWIFWWFLFFSGVTLPNYPPPGGVLAARQVLAESESYMRATTLSQPFSLSRGLLSLPASLSCSPCLAIRSPFFYMPHTYIHIYIFPFFAENFSPTCATVLKESSCWLVLGSWSYCRLAFLCQAKKDEAMSENPGDLSLSLAHPHPCPPTLLPSALCGFCSGHWNSTQK